MTRGRFITLEGGEGVGKSTQLRSLAITLEARGIDVVTFDFPYMHAKRGGPDKAPVLERCFRAVLGPRVGRRFANGRRALPRLERLLADPSDPLRADLERAAGATLAELATGALREAVESIVRHCGPEPESWRWGDVQRARAGRLDPGGQPRARIGVTRCQCVH